MWKSFPKSARNHRKIDQNRARGPILTHFGVDFEPILEMISERFPADKFHAGVSIPTLFFLFSLRFIETKKREYFFARSGVNVRPPQKNETENLPKSIQNRTKSTKKSIKNPSKNCQISRNPIF